MYGKANKPGTLQTAQMVCEEKDSPPLDSECMTRMMTPEDWAKYGPLKITSEIKKCKNRK
ncbi:MAG: hypothetical protein APF81_06245 [Desulfosporosinus sp. BRH_c37]|nr:MAG: hypothetical protein APF81_06245 [Desulfosporosinus sp. BRH_c37]